MSSAKEERTAAARAKQERTGVAGMPEASVRRCLARAIYALSDIANDVPHETGQFAPKQIARDMLSYINRYVSRARSAATRRRRRAGAKDGT
jgi:hypothetical protein